MDQPMNIIVVDDEDSIRRRCVRLLSSKEFDVVGVADGKAALNLMQSRQFDIMLVDIRMPGLDGIELLRRSKKVSPWTETIVMTGYASVDTAVRSLKEGAYDYLTKPFDAQELLHTISRLAEKKYSQREIKKLRLDLERQHGHSLLLGNSPPMGEVRRFIESVAPVNCNLVLYGESGTGKGLVARHIHINSSRVSRPFVVADCAALAPSVMESELFGHVRGSFTNAHADRKGYFESADSGTIFLDEIGELPLELQGKLLRVVEDHLVTKLGSSQAQEVDVRIIAATNRNLEDMVRRGTFRGDLFHRLNVIHLTLPPLRKRREDIPILTDYFLRHYAAKLGLSKIPEGARQALLGMEAYDWPGNVRELENAIQRALILGDRREPAEAAPPPAPRNDVIQVDVPLEAGGDYQQMKKRALSSFSKQYIKFMLREHQGNITRVSQALGLRRTSVQRLVKRHGINPAAYRP